MKTYIIIAFLSLLFVVGYYGWQWGKVLLAKDYTSMLQALYNHSIPTISIQKMATMSDYILLDTRSEEEWNVSHIPAASFVNYTTNDFSCLENIPKNKKIVVYCSVGYRSEKIGEQLLKLGYTQVYNLYGGIFAWANAKKKLVDNDNKETYKVHGYSSIWGKWITNKKIEKIYE